MNVCTVCQADGVAHVLGKWYCVDHIEDGLIDLAGFLARARGWDEAETEEAIHDWLNG